MKFNELEAQVELLSHIILSQLFESGAIEEDDQLFNELEDYEMETVLPD